MGCIQRAARASVLTAAATGAVVLLWSRGPWPSGPAAGPDATIVAVAGWLAEILASYLAVAVAVSSIASVRVSRASAGRLMALLSPRVVRRLVEAALGVSIAAALQPGAATAIADSGHPQPAVNSRATLPSLDWPGLPRHAGRRPPARAAATAPSDRRAVVVGPGDSLWTIAARALGPAAGPARIATEWPRWWAANRTVIGTDPDLIRPGQRLAPPPAELRSAS